MERPVQIVLSICSGLLTLSLLACSSETVKRTSYETFKNIEQQQCAKDLGSDCAPSVNYEDYQKRRDAELQKPAEN